MKTKKTLLKRVRITKNGKILRKSISIGHLKVKRDSARKIRSKGMEIQENPGQRKMFKKLLGKAGRNI